MAEFGHFSLCLAWLLSLFGIGAGAYGAQRGSARWYQSAVSSTILMFFSCGLAIFCLALSFYSNDYSNQYVWQFSNRDMPDIYKVSAIWGGMDGSMLLWAFIMSLGSALLAYQSQKHSPRLMSWVLAAQNSSVCFFLTIVVFFTNPFRYIKASFIPPDGNGLNPLLQNPYMAIHPPMLYCGFTTFSIPASFCLGALLAGQMNNEWIRLTRRWTLVAWAFLTTGIVLGGHWAYIELGWGGFWAWDPVENASFLPWLTGTAFLHSVMVQERKNMLKFWNVWLVVGTYALTVFGTFLTRSGVVQSVHAFASTDIGWVFLLYLAVLILVTAVLCLARRRELASDRKIESLFSREAAFLVNNLIFLSICFATLWGVMFPVLSEAVTGVKQTVSIPFFNAVNVPLFLLMTFMMGVGPLIAWRKASWSSIKRSFLMPAMIAMAASVALLWAGIDALYPNLSYSLCFFVFMTILGEFHRGMRVQTASTPGKGIAGNSRALVRRHRTRYGGHLVHLGVLIAIVGITASMAHKTEKEFSLSAGESIEIGRFKITLNDVSFGKTANHDSLIAALGIADARSGASLGEMRPELRVYTRNQETTTEVALRMSLKEDLYLVMAGYENGRAALKVFINPLQVWLWIGVVVMLLGTAVVAFPAYRAAPVEAPADNRERVKVT